MVLSLPECEFCIRLSLFMLHFINHAGENFYFRKCGLNAGGRELGSNYLLISRDFKNCMVIRAMYFKVFALAYR